MASRRLAISSLLCEDDSKTEQQVQGAPASTQDERHHPSSPYGHTPVNVPSTSTSPVMSYRRNAPSQTGRGPQDFARIMQQYPDDYAVDGSRSPSYGPASVSRTESPDPLALLPVGYKGRTPTSSSSPSGSPPLRSTYETTQYTDEEDLSRHSRNLSEGSQWSNQEYQRAHSPPTGSSHQRSGGPTFPVPAGHAPIHDEEYYPSRPSRSPVDGYAYQPSSPVVQTSVPTAANVYANSLPTLPARASLSPVAPFQPPRSLFVQTGDYIAHGSTRNSADVPFQTQSPRYSHSAAGNSPLLSAGPLSGLDALVQAATVERERIDEHRRASGSSSGLPVSHSRSPVMSRGEILDEPRFSPQQNQQVLPSARWSPVVPQNRTYSRSPVMDQRRHSPEDVRQTANTSDMQRQSPIQSFIERPTIKHSPIIDPALLEDPYGTAWSGAQGIVDTVNHNINESRPLIPQHPDEPQHGDSSTKLITVAIPAAPSPEPAKQRSHPPHSQRHPSSSSGMVAAARTPIASDTSRSIPQPTIKASARPRKPGSAALAAAKREAEAASITHTSRSTSQDVLHRKDRMRSEHGNSPTSNTTRVLPTPDDSQQTNRKPTVSRRSAQKGTTGDVDDFFQSTAASSRQADGTVGPHDGLHPNRTSITSPEIGWEAHAHAVGHQPHITSYAFPSAAIPGDEETSVDIPMYHEDASGDDADTRSASHDEDKTDIDGVLVEAVGFPSSDDAMDTEMDVDNELLSLLDGPDDYTEPRRHGPQFQPAVTHHELGIDRFAPPASMPKSKKALLSNVLSNEKHEGSKPKGKTKAQPAGHKPEAVKQKKSASSLKLKTHGGDDKELEKPKAKASAPKAGPSKLSKSGQARMTPSPVTTTPTTEFTPFDDAMPKVTSSGRVVTKSKKVAAAAAAAASISAKKRAVQMTKDRKGSLSRSQSVAPSASAEPEAKGKPEERKSEPTKDDTRAEEDDKLYCICRTKYDENLVMIACDKCDEWYHTKCVKMSELEVDLVDQFFCPLCIASNPNVDLQTTYKPRCMAGLKHPRPNTAAACHKPSRGALSKYCSDECGVKYMRSKVEGWAKQGGAIDRLWENVKGTEKRKGVIRHEPGKSLKQVLGGNADTEARAVGKDDSIPDTTSSPPPTSADQLELVDRLRRQLDHIATERELWKKELEFIQQREHLLSLAIDRAKAVEECGWDQRLCFGEDEWAEFGEGVLESYSDESKAQASHSDVNTEEHDMQVDESPWWCRGEQKCDRHAGWQKLRSSELKFEKESKENQLSNLTLKEREVRKRIEDILSPQDSALDPLTQSPKLTINKSLTNGVSGAKANEPGGKRSKKKHN